VQVSYGTTYFRAKEGLYKEKKSVLYVCQDNRLRGDTRSEGQRETYHLVNEESGTRRGKTQIQLYLHNEQRPKLKANAGTGLLGKGLRNADTIKREQLLSEIVFEREGARGKKGEGTEIYPRAQKARLGVMTSGQHINSPMRRELPTGELNCHKKNRGAGESGEGRSTKT